MISEGERAGLAEASQELTVTGSDGLPALVGLVAGLVGCVLAALVSRSSAVLVFAPVCLLVGLLAGALAGRLSRVPILVFRPEGLAVRHFRGKRLYPWSVVRGAKFVPGKFGRRAHVVIVVDPDAGANVRIPTRSLSLDPPQLVAEIAGWSDLGRARLP